MLRKYKFLYGSEPLLTRALLNIKFKRASCNDIIDNNPWRVTRQVYDNQSSLCFWIRSDNKLSAL